MEIPMPGVGAAEVSKRSYLLSPNRPWFAGLQCRLGVVRGYR